MLRTVQKGKLLFKKQTLIIRCIDMLANTMFGMIIFAIIGIVTILKAISVIGMGNIVVQPKTPQPLSVAVVCVGMKHVALL